MIVRKPEHQWETRRHRAVRKAELPAGWAATGRDEAFDLEFADGRIGRAVLGLQKQVIDGVGASDPDVVHAVRCWLAARGTRRANLGTESGTLLDDSAFGPGDLGSAVVSGVSRLVTLAPSNAEIVDALGCFDRVVACEESSDHPPAVERCERLGPDLAPDLDRVAAIAPDLAVSSLSVPGMERVVTGLRARGVDQVVLAPRSFADVVDDIVRVGRALDVGERADVVVQDLAAQRRELEAARPAKPVRVYLEWWPRPMFTPGSACFSAEIIDLAGGVNVFGDRSGSSLEITAAELVAADPDVCFVSWCGVAESKLDPDNLVRRPGLEGLRAAAEGRVYRLDERFSGRPGPRMLEAARRMAAAIRAAGLG